MMDGDDKKKVEERKKRGISLVNLVHVALVDSRALKTFLTNFLLVYNIRAGIAVLLRLLSLLAQKPKDVLSIEKLLGEKFLGFRIEAVRLGLFVGGFTGIYKAVVHSLAVYTGKVSKLHSAIGGFFGGLSILFMDESWHRTLSLYVATRMVQCFYNFAKFNGYWHFWGSDWEHGDALLFILSSAQIMYAYVMRPASLPASYYKFIVRQGPIDEVILQAVRDNCRDKPINYQQVVEYVTKRGGKDALEACRQAGLTTDKPNLIPIRALHPHTAWGALATFDAFKGVAKQIFPVYLSLALVPAVVLRFKTFAKAPGNVLWNSLLSAVRSTTFLSTFCSSYMGVIAFQRFFFERAGARDHKLWYYVAGVFSSLSILIERKSRRSELALYAFPRAVDSLYMILYDHKLAFHVPGFLVLLFCASMSTVMYFYQNATDCLSPLVAKLLERFLPKSKVTFLHSQSSLSFSEMHSGEEADDEDSDSRPGAYDRTSSSVTLSGGYSIAP